MESLFLYSGYIGVIFVAYKLIAFIWLMLRCYVFTQLGFVKNLRKYGEWVVVTGSTDGIGKGYAKELAKRGLKVVLISRSEEKLKIVQKEIEDEFKVETKIIAYDYTCADGYSAIEEALQNLDVGILVNNVGMAAGDGFVCFEEKIPEKIMDKININIVSELMMSRIVLKGMVSRQRGAVIHIASSSLYMDLPMFGIYAPTKAFMKKFYQLLDVEHGDIIHHQLVIPAVVSTKMSMCPPSFTAPMADDYAASAVRTIGLANVVWGCWVHELQGAILSHLPLTRGMNWALLIKLIATIEKSE